jgi:CheY-like chemotaxis protein
MNNNSLLVIFWQTWWFGAGIVTCLLTFPLYLNRKKIRIFKHKNSLLHQQLEESRELLKYAKENEQKAVEESEILNRSKSLLISKLSHEIRTPMNGIIGMASLLKETSLTHEQNEYADTISKCGESVMLVINNMLIADVLDYTNAVEERTEVEYKDFHLSTVIEDVLDSFADKANRSNVELFYYIDQNVPLHLVNDPLRLKQVLMNVLENAIKFTTKGEIFIGVHLLKTIDRTQVELGFEVKDTGAGFPADEIELLNKDITRINAQHDGDILGLLICKKLLALMGGYLKIESKEGAGTLFKFTIVTRVSLQPLRTTSNAVIEQKKIFVVDDNCTSQTIFKKLFEQWKLKITLANNSIDALKILSSSHFDLMIVNMEMQDMNAIELMKAVQFENINIPAILLTGKNDVRFKQYPSLFKSALTKPVKHSLLYKAISDEFTITQSKSTILKNLTDKISTDFAKRYPLRILIAEDNITNAQIASMFLKKMGYKTDIAKNGQEALEIVSDTNYDLIFMDVQMPVMDGLEATRMIRLCLNEQPVIIAMTANAMQGDRQECLQAGMDDYISKPIKIEEMNKMLEQWAIKIKDRY